MKISSKDNPIIKNLIRLYQNKKERDSSGLFIVEGYNLVEEAYKAGIIERIYSINNNEIYDNYVQITPELLKKITDTVTPEGIIAVCKKKRGFIKGDKILYLDRLQDPGNIGTILRSALSFNFDTIILDECVDLYNPKVIRSSQGSIFNLNFVNDSLNNLKEEGYYIIGTEMFGTPLTEFKNTNKKIVLILGNEGNGVRKEYLELSDINLTIPMNKMESLNVSIAGSILMYELNK